MQRFIRRRCKALDLIGPEFFNQHFVNTTSVRHYSRPLPALDESSQHDYGVKDERREADENYNRRLREMADAQMALVKASRGVQASEFVNNTRDQDRLRSHASASCSTGAVRLASPCSDDEPQWKALIRKLREAEGECSTDQMLTDTFG